MKEGTQSEIARAIVAAHKSALGKGPDSIKSYFLDDMLVVVTKGGITATERTMLDHGKEATVREVRRVLEVEMAAPLSETVSNITGREVIAYQSQIMFAPDRVIAVYIFDSPLTEFAEPATESGSA